MICETRIRTMSQGLKQNFDVFRNAFNLLAPSDRRKIRLVILIQIFMSGIDLAAVGLFGILGSLTISGVASKNPGTRVGKLLEILGLNEYQFQTQVAVIGSIAAILLISRTLLSIYFSKRIMQFLARKGADITSRLLTKLLQQPLLYIQRRSTQETLYSLTTGVANITLGIIGTAISVISDFALIAVMLGGLFVLDPIVSIATVTTFTIIGLTLNKLLHAKAYKLGNAQAELEVKSNEKILEVINTYRESVVRNRRTYYSGLISNLRFDLANVQAELSFLPNISKYVVESTVVIGSLFVCALQFVLHDATHAIASLAIFMAAGTRIAPAAMRLQQGALQVRITLGNASPTLELIKSLDSVEIVTNLENDIGSHQNSFVSSVKIKNATLLYPGRENPALSDINLEIKSGEVIAIVGPSGAGKTSLVDAMLGIIDLSSGEIKVSGVSPQKAIKRWPGKIGYVPQDVLIMSGSVNDNVALGFPLEEHDQARIKSAIEVAQLTEFVSNLPQGFETQLGERGSRISGGQRQRLGIARALFTDPEILVLDEATSALDGQTELEVSEAINNLKGKVTVVMIAHRLSTVRNADKVVYMEDGFIRSIGRFEEVRKAIPNFDSQAKLMGL